MSSLQDEDFSDIILTDNPILVVDDDNFNILALKGLLAQFNLIPDVAHNGKNAIATVQARLAEIETRPFYQLILMDYSMPEMDGPSCVANIRKILSKLPDVKHVRICCVTAYTSDKFKDVALGVGMDAFLSKPIFKNQLQD